MLQSCRQMTTCVCFWRTNSQQHIQQQCLENTVRRSCSLHATGDADASGNSVFAELVLANLCLLASKDCMLLCRSWSSIALSACGHGKGSAGFCRPCLTCPSHLEKSTCIERYQYRYIMKMMCSPKENTSKNRMPKPSRKKHLHRNINTDIF